MDPKRFDQLVVSFSTMRSRRTLLTLLPALPLVGEWLAQFGSEESAAAKRKRRRKEMDHHEGQRAHNHDGLGVAKKRKKKKKKKHKKRCTPDSVSKTCAGTCGSVLNNCKKAIDCECPACHICDEATRQCIADPNLEFTPCGEPGQFCHSDGSCACELGSCGSCEVCDGDGFCVPLCDGGGCCDEGFCVDGNISQACGRNGQACTECTGVDTCGGGGTPGVCGCAPFTTCPGGQTCGSINDGCGGTLVCGICSNPTPLCFPNNQCFGCGTDADCQFFGAGDCCFNESCFAGCCFDSQCANPTPLCVDHTCTACSDDHPCQPGKACVDGDCVPCDVCNSIACPYGDLPTAIDEAEEGATLRICPGEYVVRLEITKSLTLIGAGDGANVATNTVLSAADAGRAVEIVPGVAAVTLRNLRITRGGSVLRGGGVFAQGQNLTMTDCTVTDNHCAGDGGGITHGTGTATLTRCTISDNTATTGGGLQTSGPMTLNDTTVTGNEASQEDGGGGIFSSAAVTLENGCDISGNEAPEGTTNNCVGIFTGYGCAPNAT
jgi:hypothetical protein